MIVLAKSPFVPDTTLLSITDTVKQCAYASNNISLNLSLIVYDLDTRYTVEKNYDLPILAAPKYNLITNPLNVSCINAG